jgi:hypothetical protein
MRSGLPLLVCTFTLACDPDCTSPTRVDGEWTMFAHATSDTWNVTGFSVDDPDPVVAGEENLAQAALLEQVLVNGERSWTFKYVPGSDSYTVTIADQAYEATLSPLADNCNNLLMEMGGSWTGESGSNHSFALTADLLWTGDGLSGTYAYSDEFAYDGHTGQVSIPEGEILGSAGDTSP